MAASRPSLVDPYVVSMRALASRPLQYDGILWETSVCIPFTSKRGIAVLQAEPSVAFAALPSGGS
jgi:hypothetical protein